MARVDRWRLPDGIEELLPANAARAEQLRRSSLDLFASWGYQLVMPPLIEFTDSLLIGLGEDLDLQTFKVIDQPSGRMLALRADITPQVARIDAHSLATEAVQRLCYAGSVLHTQAASLKASRAPFQVGAELYGEVSVAADIEIICLMLETLQAAGASELTLDVGHVGIFRELIGDAGLSEQGAQSLFDLLQSKARTELSCWMSENIANSDVRSAIEVLAGLHGHEETLARARQLLPTSVGIGAALDKLDAVYAHVSARFPEVTVYFDLSELRGFHYHTGLVFAVFTPGLGTALALGGRYDDIGAVYGRGRPATGFNTDLKTLLKLGASGPGSARKPILAPDEQDDALWQKIAALRASGETVITDFGGESRGVRRLRKNGGDWKVVEEERVETE